MLSMRECEVQECVRQDRLRESEQQRLVRLVSRRYSIPASEFIGSTAEQVQSSATAGRE